MTFKVVIIRATYNHVISLCMVQIFVVCTFLWRFVFVLLFTHSFAYVVT